MKKYYKVVREHRGKLYSSVIKKRVNGVLCRSYGIGNWTHPTKRAIERGYGLLCFDDFINAVDFASNANSYLDGKMMVFECKIGMKMKKSIRWVILSSLNSRVLRKNNWGGNWPTGTVMTDKIKLIKRIK